MRNKEYYLERSYPYVISLIIFILLKANEISFVKNNNLNDAIGGINTITSLIIGFLGAMLPVILGMKNESKFVKYVFENDKNKLFLKYIREDIIIGLVLLFISICLYFRYEKVLCIYRDFLFYIWVSLIILFLLVTYRCLSNMLNLIFSTDENLMNDLYQLSDAEKLEREKIQEEHGKD